MSSIRQFSTFLSVARQGSFAAAGAEVGLSAAAVGLQIRALETGLGYSLFDRRARSIVLNSAGRALVPQAQDLLARYQAMTDVRHDGMAGTVAVGALVSALMGAFADALWQIRRDHPALVVRLFAGQSAAFAQRVEAGELDAAITTQSPRPLPASLHWSPLYSEPMVLIVPRRAPFRLDSHPHEILRQAPFLRFDRQLWTGDLVSEVLSRCRLQVREELEVNSVETLVALVRQGYGVSIIPKLANVDWGRDRGLRVLEIPGQHVERRVGLLERATHPRQAFTQAIKQHFRGQRKRASGGSRPADSTKLPARALV